MTMTIEDLKTLMDEFDPAVLLPELDTVVGKVELVARIAVLAGPVILLLLGLAYLLVSPKEANYHFGYRCYFGMGSVEAWRFSQRLAGAVWAALGLALSVVMLLVCNGFAGQEIMDILGSAVKCLLWEVGVVAVSCLVINGLVAARYDAKGYRRRK